MNSVKAKFKPMMILAVAIMCVVSMFFFVGCSSTETYTSDAGISITMEKGFYEKTLVGQTYYLESTDVIFTALKEEFSIFDSYGYSPDTMSLNDYADLVKQVNELSTDTIFDEARNLTYFTYEKTVTGRDFYYLAVVTKGSDAFWLCQFACLREDSANYTNQFLDWATTIQVN